MCVISFGISSTSKTACVDPSDIKAERKPTRVITNFNVLSQQKRRHPLARCTRQVFSQGTRHSATMPGIMMNSLSHSRRRISPHKAPVLTGLSRMSERSSISERGSRTSSVDSTASSGSQMSSRTRSPVTVQHIESSSSDDWGFFCDPVPL